MASVLVATRDEIKKVNGALIFLIAANVVVKFPIFATKKINNSIRTQDWEISCNKHGLYGSSVSCIQPSVMVSHSKLHQFCSLLLELSFNILEFKVPLSLLSLSELAT